ncbi:MAG: hypothetical protein ACRDD7_08545 [Peptostreptococcaceae bacterium]
MFTVYDKENKEVKVYDVQRDKCGYPQFLVRHNNAWIYRSAKHYTDKIIPRGLYQRYHDDKPELPKAPELTTTQEGVGFDFSWLKRLFKSK